MQAGATAIREDAIPLPAAARVSTKPSRQWLRIGSPLLLLVLWQISAAEGWVSSHTLASPAQVIVSLWGLVLDGTLQQNLLVSLERVAKGLVLAVVAGGSLALLSGLSRLGEYAIDAPMQMFRTLPVLALIPFFILWFGIGETPKVALIAVAATFPVYLTLYAGIRGVDTKLIEVAKVINLSRTELIRHVILPAALPSGLVGLRYAVGVSWLILVVVEQINATSGIGYLMNDARDFMRTDIMVVGLLIYAVLGLVVDIVIRFLERRLLAWRPSLLGTS
jgi:sulfonate transport system permease protein